MLGLIRSASGATVTVRCEYVLAIAVPIDVRLDALRVSDLGDQRSQPLILW